jgi:hypothetical protein
MFNWKSFGLGIFPIHCKRNILLSKSNNALIFSKLVSSHINVNEFGISFAPGKSIKSINDFQ